MIGRVSTYQIALLVHVFGVIVMLGGILTAGLAYYAARGREKPSEVAAVLSLSRLGVIVGGLGFAIVAGFGLWLDYTSGQRGWHPLEPEKRHPRKDCTSWPTHSSRPTRTWGI